MVGGSGRRGFAQAVLVAVVGMTVVAGCAAEPDPGPTVPTFPDGSTSTTAAAAGAVDTGDLPDDCNRLLPVADLGALLGMPLDTVAVRSTIGVPAPSVGRTERLDCSYTGTAGGPARGRTLLGLNAAAYDGDPAAAAQWKVNAAAEDGARRDVAIGAASAVLVERRGESVLTVVYGSGTLTFVLPAGKLPGGRAAGDVLVDMALRVLPALAGLAPTPTPTPAPPTTASGVEPAQAAGTS